MRTNVVGNNKVSPLAAVPPPDRIRERLEANYAEARLLRKLLQLSRQVEQSNQTQSRRAG